MPSGSSYTEVGSPHPHPPGGFLLLELMNTYHPQKVSAGGLRGAMLWRLLQRHQEGWGQGSAILAPGA